MNFQAAFYYASLQMCPKLEAYPFHYRITIGRSIGPLGVRCGKEMGKLSVPFLNEMTRLLGSYS
jgi:hypothetical protein